MSVVDIFYHLLGGPARFLTNCAGTGDYDLGMPIPICLGIYLLFDRMDYKYR